MDSTRGSTLLSPCFVPNRSGLIVIIFELKDNRVRRGKRLKGEEGKRKKGKRGRGEKAVFSCWFFLFPFFPFPLFPLILDHFAHPHAASFLGGPDGRVRGGQA